MSSKGPWILGISASHNGSTCLLRGGEIVVAIQEERLTRNKRQVLQPGFPFLGWRYCLDGAGIRPADLSAIVVCAQGAVGSLANHIDPNPQLAEIVGRVPILTIPHHRGHAVSALATSGFEEAAILVVDGVGSPVSDLHGCERASIVTEVAGSEMISLYRGAGRALECVEKHTTTRHLEPRAGLHHFGTLGMMYGAVALQIFGDPLEAGKVMGLAPYGRARFPVEHFFEIVDGRFRFTNEIGAHVAGEQVWPDHGPLYQDLAASVQRALEHAVLYLAGHLQTLVGSKNLAYAGGVALNGIANERLYCESGFEHLHIVPASDDSGAAIGAAFHGLWEMQSAPPRPRRRQSDASGRSYGTDEIDAAIGAAPAVVSRCVDDIVAATADLLEQGAVVGWFQGRSELGPRALGQRSILMDPRLPDGKDRINAEVKFRESFRPFAPAILEHRARQWFELDGVSAESPFMLRVSRFRTDRAALVPAVVHVDGTGRLQTVSRANDPLFYELLLEIERRTGVPIVLNTSFNTIGEPIVETPEDALWCLLGSGLDACVLGSRIVTKVASYSGLLDLSPRLVASPLAPLPASIEAARHATEPIRFRVETPWGHARTSVGVEMLPALLMINGRRSGRRMLALGRRCVPGFPDQTALVDALRQLQRRRVLQFDDRRRI